MLIRISHNSGCNCSGASLFKRVRCWGAAFNYHSMLMSGDDSPLFLSEGRRPPNLESAAPVPLHDQPIISEYGSRYLETVSLLLLYPWTHTLLLGQLQIRVVIRVPGCAHLPGLTFFLHNWVGIRGVITRTTRVRWADPRGRMSISTALVSCHVKRKGFLWVLDILHRVL